MKKYFWFAVLAQIVLILSSTKAIAQFPLGDNSGEAVFSRNKLFYAIEYEEPEEAINRFKQTKKWVKKLSSQTKNENWVDYFELVETRDLYVFYVYQDNYSFRYEMDRNKPQSGNGRVLGIELPQEYCELDNVMKLYNYMKEHVDLSQEKPYEYALNKEEIINILNSN